MHRIDPQETINLYKKYEVTPITGRLSDTTGTGACALGINYLHKVKEAKTRPLETATKVLGLPADWFGGFADAFDGRILSSSGLNYENGFSNGLEVREAVLKEFGRIPTWSEFVFETPGRRLGEHAASEET